MSQEGPADPHPDPAALPGCGNGMTPDRLLGRAMAFWPSALLLCAHELGLFAVLAAGPCDAAALGRRLGLQGDMAADFLDALVDLDLVERCGCLYRNTPEAGLFLDPAGPSYIGRWLAMAGAALREMAALTTTLRASGADARARAPLAESMWADIERIMRDCDGG